MSVNPNSMVHSPVAAALKRTMLPSAVLRPGLSVDEMRQRVALLDFGSTFRILGAELAFTADGVKRWTPLFGPAGIQIEKIRTLHQLTAEHSAWLAKASVPERRRLALRVCTEAIPSDSSQNERLERRLLLTMAKHLTIERVDIQLTAEGVEAFAQTLSNLNIASSRIVTLAQLAQLQYDEATLAVTRMMQPEALATLQANYDARKKAARGGLQNEG